MAGRIVVVAAPGHRLVLAHDAIHAAPPGRA